MLIKCPECGKDVSSEAVSCPRCGYPIKRQTNVRLNNQSERSEKEIRELIAEAKECSSASTASAAIGLIMFFGGIISIVLAFAVIEDGDVSGIIAVLGTIFAPLGFLILVIGCSVNGTKYNNRIKIIEEYKKQHPEFKEE